MPKVMNGNQRQIAGPEGPVVLFAFEKGPENLKIHRTVRFAPHKKDSHPTNPKSWVGTFFALNLMTLSLCCCSFFAELSVFVYVKNGRCGGLISIVRENRKCFPSHSHFLTNGQMPCASCREKASG